MNGYLPDKYGNVSGGFYCADVLERVRLENIVFRDNSAIGAGGVGGAIFVTGGIDWGEFEVVGYGLEVDRCTFFNNYASRGAAIGLGQDAFSGVQIANSQFYMNGDDQFPTVAGGAIYLPERSYCLAANLLIYNNYAERGGGIFVRNHGGSVPGLIETQIFRHCTIANNYTSNAQPSGGGFHVAASPLNGSPYSGITIDNSILWANSGADDVVAQFPMGVPVRVRYSDYGSVSSGVILQNSISQDPQFVNAAAGNYALAVSPVVSPCIDQANDNYTGSDFADVDENNQTNEPLPIDLRGAARTHDHPAAAGSSADMGAYERHGN